MRSTAAATSPGDIEDESISTSSMPRFRSAAYWSSMSAMSGETTSVTPGATNAGSW
jgi:hypothetical protein